MGCCIPNNRIKDKIITTYIPPQDIISSNKATDNRMTTNNLTTYKKENEPNINKNENVQNLPITTNINNINININKITNKSDLKSSSTNKEYQNEKQSKIIKPVLDINDKKLLKEIFSNHFLFKNKSNRLISSILAV